MTAPAFRISVAISLITLSISAGPLYAQNEGTTNSSSQEDPLMRPHPKKTKAEDRAFKKWLDEVSSIITPEEQAAFRRLTNDTERQNFVELFWQHRDPTPDTEENEYKDEFYRRQAYARERFSAGKPGDKTDRGLLYIRRGPPDSVESHPAGGPYQRTAQEGGGQTQTFPFEIWRYRHLDGIGDEIEVEFVDTCGCGDYHMTLDRGEKDALSHVPGAGLGTLESMLGTSKAQRSRGIENLPESPFDHNRESRLFDEMWKQAKLNAPPDLKKVSGTREDVSHIIRTNFLPFDYRVDYVKAGLETVSVPVTIQVPNSALTYVSKDGLQQAKVLAFGRVTTLTGKIAQTFEEPLRLDVSPDLLEKFTANTSVYQKTLLLPPGRYKLELIVKDVNGDKLGMASRSLSVPDFSDEKLATSSLILADLMEPVAARDIGAGSFVLGAMKVRPRVAPASAGMVEFRHGQKVGLWMQVYHLGNGGGVGTKVEYQVKNAANGQIVMDTTEAPDVRGNQATLAKNLTPSLSQPGEYQVIVRVRDGLTRQTIEQAAKFAVR
jgi:GWxTD domain-containing protein